MVDKSFCLPITGAAGPGQRSLLAGDGWRVCPVCPLAHSSITHPDDSSRHREGGRGPAHLPSLPPRHRGEGLELPRLTESPMRLKNKLCWQGSPRDAGEMNNATPVSNLQGFEKLSARGGACLDGFIGDFAFLRQRPGSWYPLIIPVLCWRELGAKGDLRQMALGCCLHSFDLRKDDFFECENACS